MGLLPFGRWIYRSFIQERVLHRLHRVLDAHHCHRGVVSAALSLAFNERQPTALSSFALVTQLL